MAPPDYTWDDRDNLFLRYQYDFFMPKGILSQFIVQMHRYIRNHANAHLAAGRNFERENTWLKSSKPDARTIKIRSGQNKRDL
jgi:hypothetical protein